MRTFIVAFVMTLLDAIGHTVGYTRTEITRGRKERSYGDADTEIIKTEVGEMITENTKIKLTKRSITIDNGDVKLKIRRK